ncbi:hypothetical protein S245_037350, partial [Arachis hypogaea]
LAYPPVVKRKQNSLTKKMMARSKPKSWKPRKHYKPPPRQRKDKDKELNLTKTKLSALTAKNRVIS